MEVYLDNSATTPCSEAVREIVVRTMMEDYGNPSSLHRKGIEAEKYIKEAKERICKILKAKDKEILFTSGGTESNNMALIGTAMANRRKGNHLITSVIEHASVKNTMKYLEEQGFRVSYIPVDRYGVLDLEKLEEELCEDTILVSIMHVNNEIGTIQPIEEISKIIQKKSKNAYFHVDAIQSFGKLEIYPKRFGIHLLSVSGHKIHGPKGVGFLYIQEGVKINPIIFGGGQQKDMRSGTENVPGVAGLGQATLDVYTGLKEKQDYLYDLRRYFIERLKEIPDTGINGFEDEKNAPHIVSVNVKGVRSEVLLHALEEQGIYVSSGSACSSNKHTASGTLLAIGRNPKEEEGTIRFSFSTRTKKEELDYSLEQLGKWIPMLQKYRRK